MDSQDKAVTDASAQAMPAISRCPIVSPSSKAADFRQLNRGIGPLMTGEKQEFMRQPFVDKVRSLAKLNFTAHSYRHLPPKIKRNAFAFPAGHSRPGQAAIPGSTCVLRVVLGVTPRTPTWRRPARHRTRQAGRPRSPNPHISDSGLLIPRRRWLRIQEAP